METMPAVTLNMSGEEVTILGELLEAEQARLLVEIRHTDHRSFREELRRKLAVIEYFIDCCKAG